MSTDPLTEQSFRPLTSTVGAVADVNLADDLTDCAFAAIKQALHQYGVLFFENQGLDTAKQIALAKRFGPIYHHRHVPEGIPDITVLDYSDTASFGSKQGTDGKPSKSILWHTDASFEDMPPYVAILRAVTLPPIGGDTIWISMCGAYDALSSRMQRFLSELTAIHSSSCTLERAGISDREPHTSKQPVIIVDPVTGRKALYVNAEYTQRIIELSATESASVLTFLFAHMVSPDFQVRFRWSSGAVAMWNERITQHYGVGDYEAQRVLHRVIASGPGLG